MRLLRIGLPIFLLGVTVLLAADDDLPKRPNFDRYKGMLEHSPFAVASAVIVPAGAPNFAKDLYVANAAKSPDGDLVTIGSTSDRDFKKYLTTKGPVDGYGIANIEWSDKVGETKVTISKDGQFATLTFNQALLTQPLPNKPSSVAVPAGVISPPSRQQVVPYPKPGQIPLVPTPTPHVRSVIQRNPAMTPPVTPPPARAEQ